MIKLFSKYPNYGLTLLFGSLGLLIVFFLPVSCKKPTAQYPSNKTIMEDSASMLLRDYNKELIQKEDSVILNLILRQTVNFKKNESGLWYYIQKQTDNEPVTNDSTVTVNYKIYEINGKLLTQEENKTIHFGKKEVIPGIEEGLKLLKKGEFARFIVPSYLAFGAQGTDVIPPFTPIILLLEVN
ncbi:MAG: hypothetical protein GX102_13605 [Porphyromonadaceae bacterium]|jgi:FKBP-type peptidyl-prolyl cis-trans isomerase|nr:hypothetical protein [Porphyromonadaceae bacterium]